MTTLREHLEAIIVRGYSPTKDDDRADAVAALAILDKARKVGGNVAAPGDPKPRKQHRLVPDPPVPS